MKQPTFDRPLETEPDGQAKAVIESEEGVKSLAILFCFLSCFLDHLLNFYEVLF